MDPGVRTPRFLLAQPEVRGQMCFAFLLLRLVLCKSPHSLPGAERVCLPEGSLYKDTLPPWRAEGLSLMTSSKPDPLRPNNNSGRSCRNVGFDIFPDGWPWFKICKNSADKRALLVGRLTLESLLYIKMGSNP